jgi:hypothetical protein
MTAGHESVRGLKRRDMKTGVEVQSRRSSWFFAARDEQSPVQEIRGERN